jgi:hypothetical protein
VLGMLCQTVTSARCTAQKVGAVDGVEIEGLTKFKLNIRNDNLGQDENSLQE